MRIGLITIFQVPNYGSVLQTFATQYVLEEMGADCRVINYKYPNEWHWRHGAPRPSKFRSFVRRLIPTKKVRVLEDFRISYYHLTKEYHSLDELRAENWSEYGAFVVGSDQVWNARFLLGDTVFMLSFSPEGKPRYSIASSFASKSLPEQVRDRYYHELSLFSAISVREQNAIRIINSELGIRKPVRVLLDPTLLLSKEDWMGIIPRSSFRKLRPYILLYMWTYAFEPRPYIFKVIKYLQSKMDCDVIVLEGYTKPENADGIVMKDYSGASIPEFVDLFANADIVVTSSFHGTAFALNFGIPLVSVVPDGDDDDRQTTLLRRVKCEQSSLPVGSDLSEIAPYYDAFMEQELLNELRREDLCWIKDKIING